MKSKKGKPVDLNKLGVTIRSLGHPVALKIVKYLVEHREGCSSGDLTAALKMPTEVVIFHLLSMEEQKLVRGELVERPPGAVRIYFAVPKKFNEVVKELMNITSAPP